MFKYNGLIALKSKLNNKYKDLKVLVFNRYPSKYQAFPKTKERFIAKKSIIAGGGIVLVISTLLLIPGIPTKQILIEGTAFYDNKKLASTIGLSSSPESLSIAEVFSLRSKLLSNEYISRVSIKYSPIGTLVFSITEDYPVGYIEFLNEKFYIDQTGTVLESSKTEYRVPEIFGVSLEYISAGAKIPFTPVQLSILKAVSSELLKYDLDDVVELVDVSDVEKIRFTCGELEVLVGTIDIIETKMEWLVEIYQTHTSGYLDLTQVDKGVSTIHPN